MKRRGFLRLLGAAVAAPALPAIAPGGTAAATYLRYVWGLGVFHARTRPHVSVRGLAHRLKLPPEQARLMLEEMSRKGLVTPIGGSGGSVRAVSNILKPDMWGLDAAARKARAATRRAKLLQRNAARVEPDLSALMAHLHMLCRKRGLTVAGQPA